MKNILEQIKLHKYTFAETAFDMLMKNRIQHVLLICSKYDAFILEEDGRVDEQIFMEYVSLNLRYPPQFIQVSNAKDAYTTLQNEKIDLIITMSSIEDMDVFEFAGELKKDYTKIPLVLLTVFSRDTAIRLHKQKMGLFDYVFSWLGNSSLLLAIIKLIEDKMNAEHDILDVGVQCILLVENSVRFYSSYLPNIYTFIFEQSKKFMMEGLNEHQKMLRMRGRPKIFLATDFEEAFRIYETYKENLLGIISDVSYNRNGKMDKRAGIKLCELVKANDPFLPILLQSSDQNNKLIAKKIKAGFIYKNSKSLSIELKEFINEYFAFGDFKFIDPETHRVLRSASNLRNLQEVIFDIPDRSLRYHIERNHFSKWLTARALFPLAEVFRSFTVEDFKDLKQIRNFLYTTISNYRKNKGRGIIAKFYHDQYDEYQIFSRIGEGSIGGKARGLAFVDSLIKRNYLLDKYDPVIVSIPRTVVISTDVFDEFMSENSLYRVALSDISDEEILQYFIKSKLPLRIDKDLLSFIRSVKGPIAIRSSSLLEDSHYQPFAGVYSTYMIPAYGENECDILLMVKTAIKSVYASVYYKSSKHYMLSTSNVIDEEKMALVLQEVVGKRYGERFYPTLSGVARSINFYPIEPEKAEDGIVNLAFGLGKYVVEGNLSLRFSPKFPKKILQLSSPEMALSETQKKFYSLYLDCKKFKPSINDGINLQLARIKSAEEDGSLRYVASTYDYNNHIIQDGMHYEGKRLVTFANILKYNSFPLAKILSDLLEISQREMNNPVEIEFAANLDVDENEAVTFNVLQIRPIVDVKETIDEDLSKIEFDKTIISSHAVLGNGIVKDVYDLVYIRPENFDAAKTIEMVSVIDKINTQFIQEGKYYVLIGPGRWGSNDPWLGIPVKWAQISNARAIIESGLENYRIDPSQGTHFFQNLTSFRVAYYTINPFINDGYYDLDFLNNQDAVFEDHFIRHIRFENPVVIKTDSKNNLGVILKPAMEITEIKEDESKKS